MLQNLYQTTARPRYFKVRTSTHPARARESHITPHSTQLPPPSPRPPNAAATTMSVSTSEASDNDDFSQYAPGHMPMPDFEALARDIQNRASRRVGAATTETRHFREFFGTSVLVIEKTWGLLERDSLLPEGGRPKHLLWALHFMKVYPKQNPRVFGSRRVCRRRQPKDPPQVGLGVYRRRRQPGRRGGE